MKKLMTICLVASLMLISASVSWAVPAVTPPPGAPSWWNVECQYYAYGWWQSAIGPGDTDVPPPDNPSHWASNWLSNTDFKASLVGNTFSIDLTNYLRPDLIKEIFILVQGTSDGGQAPENVKLDTDSGTFSGTKLPGGDGIGSWSYKVDGVIRPQPDYVKLSFDVPGLTAGNHVTNIWAGENCIPEPATIGLLGLGALSLIRRKHSA
ncbi:MAG: PEP-CTERM sorting domain-containing protein [Sedimentisphaerales bacterium]